jgi:hypothetical protein
MGAVPPAAKRLLTSVHFFAAFARQADQHFGALGRIRDRLVGKALEEGFDQQHHIVVVFAHHHAGALLVGELRVEGKAQAAKERLGALHVLDGQVDEHLA